MFNTISGAYDVYPEILGFNYFQEPLPDLTGYKFVFVHSDFGFPIKANIIQFLTGAEKCHENTYSWNAIDLDDVKPLPLSEYTEVPSVGFVGRIPIKDGKLHRGFEPRYLASKALHESPGICYDAHVRYEPEGPSCSFYPAIQDSHKKDAPLFRNNLNANQYNLCARGNGNYSQRLYETLASGRIPVYIDSRGRIPWDHFIDYESFDCFVWVKDATKTAETLLEFHETHNLQKCQRECRDIFETYLSTKAQIKLFEEHVNEFKPY